MTRQLPAGRCLVHAVKSVRNNIAYAFRISWPWYAILIPLGVGASYLINYFTGGNPQAMLTAPVILTYLVLIVVSMVAFASIAVNWHRYILLDEVPQGGEIFRLDDKTWRYLGNVVLIFLIVFAISAVIMLPIFGIFALAWDSGIAAFFPLVLFLILMAFVAALFFRLSVKLPAIALGRHDFRLTDSLAATQENNLRLLGLALLQFLTVFAALLVMLLLLFVTALISPMLGVIVGAILQFLFNWIFTIFGITLLTSLYGFFVEQRDF